MRPDGGGVPLGALRRISPEFRRPRRISPGLRRSRSAHFGSGWVWLVSHRDRLRIPTTSDAELPLGTATPRCSAPTSGSMRTTSTTTTSGRVISRPSSIILRTGSSHERSGATRRRALRSCGVCVDSMRPNIRVSFPLLIAVPLLLANAPSRASHQPPGCGCAPTAELTALRDRIAAAPDRAAAQEMAVAFVERARSVVAKLGWASS